MPNAQLRRMRPVILTLGRVVLSATIRWRIAGIDRAIDAIVAEQARLPPASPLRAVIDLINERLRIAHTLAVPANLTPGADLQGHTPPLWQQAIRPLRANLNWQSPALRHALAHRGCMRAALGVHHGLVQPIRPLADHHRRCDDAAVFLADLHPGARTDRRHRPGRPHRRRQSA